MNKKNQMRDELEKLNFYISDVYIRYKKLEEKDRIMNQFYLDKQVFLNVISYIRDRVNVLQNYLEIGE